MSESLEKATQSLLRMQDFDPETLPRIGDLGKELSFEKAVSPARRLVSLYRRLAAGVLEDLPDKQLDSIQSTADADFNRLQQILDFSTSVQNPKEQRDSLVSQLAEAYAATFRLLQVHIAYGASKSADLQRMETEARAMLQRIRDDADALTAKLQEDRDSAGKILEEVRVVAAEQGVSQQAIHFKSESDHHSTESEQWRKATIGLSFGLGVYALASMFVHKIPWLSPTDTYQAIQLVASKVLIFAVISYMLFLSAKNFLSHKHNSIVNKHRQNALMTFTALADAASDEQQKGLVLTHASACIFAPQETGYAKGGGEQASGLGRTAVELIPKAMIKLDA